MYSLQELGWSDFFASQCARHSTSLAPARIATESHELYRILSPEGDFLAELTGKFRHEAQSRAGFPAVGDWVLADLRASERRATIHEVLTRKSRFSRKAAGKTTEEQIVAANLDLVFLVSSLNQEFNPRRVERYAALAWDSGARPIIVLNKADLCAERDSFRLALDSAATGVELIFTSALTGEGLADLRSTLRKGLTAAFLGSSGVGKSSLINALIGSAPLPTQPVRAGDDRGRHTTTARHLMVLPNGGLLIDTPGMRELQLWDAADGIGRAFTDIQELAARCKFRDCTHNAEPGCAVRAAVDSEALAGERLASFHKLEREERFLEAKQDAAVRSQRTKELRRLMKSVNRLYRDRDKGN